MLPSNHVVWLTVLFPDVNSGPNLSDDNPSWSFTVVYHVQSAFISTKSDEVDFETDAKDHVYKSGDIERTQTR